MVDNLNPESGRDRAHRSEPAPSAKDALPDALRDAPTDREVGLSASGHPAAEVQQWLDGEQPEAAARRTDARDVELWSRISEETTRRGRMTTPAPVLDRLMAAIPPAKETAPEPWWRKFGHFFR